MSVKLQLVSWKADRLTRRLPRRILEDFGPTIGYQLQQEIAKDQFRWPNVTRRRSGAVVSSPRDIVDTGRFLNSQTEPRIEEKDGAVSLVIEWTAPYAADIFNGVVGDDFVNYSGTIKTYDPERRRDWITPALKAQPVKPFFTSRWAQLAGGRG